MPFSIRALTSRSRLKSKLIRRLVGFYFVILKKKILIFLCLILCVLRFHLSFESDLCEKIHYYGGGHVAQWPIVEYNIEF